MATSCGLPYLLSQRESLTFIITKAPGPNKPPRVLCSKKGANTYTRPTKKLKVIEMDSSDDKSMDDVRQVDEIEELTVTNRPR
jgi:hypothetical protein